MRRLEAKLRKAIEDAEQMLVVCAHAGTGVPSLVLRSAARLRRVLTETQMVSKDFGRRYEREGSRMAERQAVGARYGVPQRVELRS